MLLEFARSFVFYDQVPNHRAIKPQLMAEIDARRGQEADTWDNALAVSSIHNPKPFNDFLKTPEVAKAICWTPFRRMLNAIEAEAPASLKRPDDTLIGHIWYNRYGPGYFQEIHNHSGQTPIREIYRESWTGLYLLSLEEDVPNSTVFTRASQIVGDPGNREYISTAGVPAIKEGTVIFFPHYMDHYVNPYLGQDERISVTFNLFSYWAA